MLSLPISRRSLAYPPARSPFPTNSFASLREILWPMIILCSSVLWRNCRVDRTLLLTAYLQGLDPQIRAQLAIYDDNISLESFMQKAVKISQRLRACQPDITAHSPSSPAACPPVPVPMQVDTNGLSPTEHARCLPYCGVLGHFIRVCPSHPPCPTVSTLHLEPPISTLPLLTVQLLTQCNFISTLALVDSGSSGNLHLHLIILQTLIQSD